MSTNRLFMNRFLTEDRIQLRCAKKWPLVPLYAGILQTFSLQIPPITDVSKQEPVPPPVVTRAWKSKEKFNYTVRIQTSVGFDKVTVTYRMRMEVLPPAEEKPHQVRVFFSNLMMESGKNRAGRPQKFGSLEAEFSENGPFPQGLPWRAFEDPYAGLICFTLPSQLSQVSTELPENGSNVVGTLVTNMYRNERKEIIVDGAWSRPPENIRSEKIPVSYQAMFNDRGILLAAAMKSTGPGSDYTLEIRKV